MGPLDGEAEATASSADSCAAVVLAASMFQSNNWLESPLSVGTLKVSKGIHWDMFATVDSEKYRIACNPPVFRVVVLPPILNKVVYDGCSRACGWSNCNI